jgi:ribosomal protein L37AE/L43A
MAELEKLGATKRCGARYGRTNKHNFIKVEKDSEASQMPLLPQDCCKRGSQ